MAKQIVLIPCGSKKLALSAKAKGLYTGKLFKLNLEYAYKLKPYTIYILSAEYGLLTLEQVIKPYEKTLNKMPISERRAWASRVIKQMKEKGIAIKQDKFTFLAGQKYREFLVPEMNKNNIEIPLEGLGIGKQLQRLKKLVSTDMSFECKSVHQLINGLQRHCFPFDVATIPMNGIYILFEKNEGGHGQERIVRIGTHTGNNQLRSRLKQHFLNKNKDRSIFRKNIGRALLNQRCDQFLSSWELDLTTRKAKEKHSAHIDKNYQQSIEIEVSEYIQSNFTFSVFEVESKQERLQIESAIIATVSLCDECRPSRTWLGNSSPKQKIVESGLWQVNELYKEPFNEDGIEKLARLINI